MGHNSTNQAVVTLGRCHETESTNGSFVMDPVLEEATEMPPVL